jgi:hypothetical protein
MDDLLPDSARTPSDEPNNESGCPKNASAGVLQSWYALRATYSRELKVQAHLQEKGVRTFVPMMWQSSPARLGIQRKLVPAISNLVFVYWTREGIDSYIRSFGDARPVNYYWDRTTNSPLTIPDKDMDNFITVASTLDEDLIYLTEISDKLREGQTVKVKEGPFKGVEGKVVRIRKSRRILVELPGMLAVASTYVAPEELEII